MVLNKIKDKIKPFCNCLIIIVLTVLPVKWGYALENPNVLLIIADDLTYSDLPLYVGMNIDTPNIVRLCKEGLVFNHAYLSSSVCFPCRSTLHTLMYPLLNVS